MANNGAEAISFLKKVDDYCLIIMDLQMPEMDGYAATKYIRTEMKFSIPIIAMTASALKGEKTRCLEIGMNDYLSKPFEPRELLLRIGSVLRRTRAAPAGSVESGVVRFGRFAFSLERGELRAGDDPVRITEREREMLRLLSANPGAIVSREALSGRR